MFPQHATPSSPQRFLPFLLSLKRLLQLQACVCIPIQGLELSPGPDKHAILFNPCHTLEGELWQSSCSREDRLGKDKCSQHLLNGDPRPALCWTLCPHPLALPSPEPGCAEADHAWGSQQLCRNGELYSQTETWPWQVRLVQDPPVSTA